ncbi:MAG TPA: IclR family transcriptional regulator C-terminal domain-containing protein [Micromonosporaceae bacterium]|nr:IclR family transcriptional regulator C-terminal domain-containing protein [Micromonosporaceae bacterium]
MQYRPDPSDLIRTVSRAIRLLEAVAMSRSGLTIRELARSCRFSLATTYHLVRSLEHEGYLVRRDDGHYVPGIILSDPFSELAAVFHAPDIVEESLRRLARDTGHSHFLGRFVTGKVTVTAVVEGQQSPHMEDLIIGFDDAAHATAMGKALLATLSPEQRRRYLKANGMRRYTDATITEPQELEYDLGRYIPNGIFLELGQYRNDLACVSTLVSRDPDPARQVVVACVMPVTVARTTGAVVLAQRIRRAATGLAHALRAEYGPGPVAL